MKRFPKIFATACVAVAFSASLALAAEAPKKAKAPAQPAPAAHQMGGMGMMGGGMGMMGGMMGGMGGQMGLAALSPEKQELAKAILAEHKNAMFPLHQSLYAKNAELEAQNAAGNGESDKARAVIREIADLHAKMLTENARFRARLVKETGLRAAPMGHGQMGGMMGGHMGMMGGMSGMGMMGGEMKCPMMEKMMGGAPQGAAPAAPAGKAPAKIPAHGAHQ